MDISPRAWGEHMDVVRFFQAGTNHGDGVPGLLLGALIRQSDRLGHRGHWLRPTWAPQEGDPHLVTEGIADEADLDRARHQHPSQTLLTWRNKDNIPAPAEDYFLPTTPRSAEYTRGGQGGDPAQLQAIQDAWFEHQQHERPAYARGCTVVRLGADGRLVVAPMEWSTGLGPIVVRF